MEMIKAVVIAAALFMGIMWVYLLMTKPCWSCRHRLGRRATICGHCGRPQRRKRKKIQATA